jgi:hypothetical protein
MSTRCQVILKDKWGHELWFYRHSDGYPEGVMPSLEQFLGWLKKGLIRDNVEQAGGWLILLGAKEYGSNHSYAKGKWVEIPKSLDELFAPGKDNSGMGWKCGAYEPCSHHEKHGDIEYLYTIDLEKQTITTETA